LGPLPPSLEVVGEMPNLLIDQLTNSRMFD